ncbi:MAG: discoidin domain-containing protein, partial [Phycisphaerales bacterium]
VAGSSRASIDPQTAVGVWLFDDGGGGVATDASGNGNDGTLFPSDNGPQWTAESQFGGALEFDGTGVYIEFATGENLKTPNFTIMAWFSTRKLNGYGHIFQTGTDWNDMAGYVLRVHQSGTAQAGLAFGPGNLTTFVTGPSLEADRWYHMALTFDGTTATLYLDGELVATGAGQGDIMYDDQPVRIGVHSQDTGAAFDGFLDEVALFDVALEIDDIQLIMDRGLVEIIGGPPIAVKPQPASGQTDVPRDPVLSWTPGEFAATHNVYLGDNFEDVNSGAPGTLIAEGIAEASVTPGRLEFATTYYWRVDEVNAAPDNTIFTGDIWSFTVEPFAYPIAGVMATSNGDSSAGQGPENTVNGSGLNANGEHSINAMDMWLATPGAEPLWIQYEFDRLYQLHQMLVWNYNVQFELVLGFGLKDVTVEYSTDGVEWTVLTDAVFAQAPAQTGYAANTTVDFGGVAARFVRLRVGSGYGPLGQFGLSEVQFLYIPTHPREPQPTDGAVDIAVDTTLAWRSGRDAISHEVSLGIDPDALTLVDTVSTSGYDPGPLDLDTTYYWQINEIQEVEAWTGDVWSFATQAYLVVDDFESYNDEDDLIYETWIDGWVNQTGSTVGYLEAPFAERTIVKSGRQSMPLFYDNDAVNTSEADFELAQDWTTSGILSLSLSFHGDPANTPAQLYVKINTTKIAYDGDLADLGRGAWQAWNIDLAGAGNVSNVRSLTIGIEGTGATGVVYIDDIRLYARAPELVTPVAPDDANLVAHYAFDGSLDDNSGSGFDGIANGAPTYGPGNDGQALVLDGIQDYVSIAGVGISGAAARTISGWVKAETTTILAWTNVFGFTGPSTNGQHFDIEAVGDTGTTTLGYYGLHRHGWEQNILPIDLEWHHLAATFDGTTVRWYGDGIPIGSAGADNVNTPGTFHVGKRQDNENFFPGSVDAVRVYDRALSDGEIAYLAGRTAPLHRPF